MSALLPDLAAHLSKRDIVITQDVARGLVAGKKFRIDGRVIRTVAREREMVRQVRWAERVKLCNER